MIRAELVTLALLTVALSAGATEGAQIRKPVRQQTFAVAARAASPQDGSTQSGDLGEGGNLLDLLNDGLGKIVSAAQAANSPASSVKGSATSSLDRALAAAATKSSSSTNKDSSDGKGNPAAVASALSQAGTASPTVSDFPGGISGSQAAKETGKSSSSSKKQHKSSSSAGTDRKAVATGSSTVSHGAKHTGSSKGSDGEEEHQKKHNSSSAKTSKTASSTIAVSPTITGAPSAKDAATDGSAATDASIIPSPSGTWTWIAGGYGCPDGAAPSGSAHLCSATTVASPAAAPSNTARATSATAESSSAKLGRINIPAPTSNSADRVMIPIHKRRLADDDMSFDDRSRQYQQLKELQHDVAALRKQLKSKMVKSPTLKKTKKGKGQKKFRPAAQQGQTPFATSSSHTAADAKFTSMAEYASPPAKLALSHTTTAADARGTASGVAIMTIPLPFVNWHYKLVEGLLPALVGWSFLAAGLTPLALMTVITVCGVSRSVFNIVATASAVSTFSILRVIQKDLVDNSVLLSGSDIDQWFTAACLIISALQVLFAVVIRMPSRRVLLSSSPSSQVTSSVPRPAWLSASGLHPDGYETVPPQDTSVLVRDMATEEDRQVMKA